MWPATYVRLAVTVLTQTILLSLLTSPPIAVAQKIIEQLSCNFDNDTLCNWTFLNGNAKFEPIFNYTNFENNNGKDRILVIRPGEDSKKDGFAVYSIKSPAFESQDYELIFNVNANFIGDIYIIVIKSPNIEYQIMKVTGKQHQIWDTYTVKLPKHNRMNILLEVKFDPDRINFDFDYVAINNVHIVDKRKKAIEKCDYQCNGSNKCLASDNICDTLEDCPSGDDEAQQCDKLPPGSYCSFKHNFCHWFNYDNGNSSGKWIHTKNESNNGGSLGAVFQGIHQFGAVVNIKSVIFDEIPQYHSISSSNYYKSCKARFAYLFSHSSIELLLYFEPQVQDQRLNPTILWRFYNRKETFEWKDVSIPLPVNRQMKYRLKFSASIALNSASTFSQKVLVAIKKFSLSKECFGIGVPENEARNPPFVDTFNSGKPFAIPKNKSIKNYRFTSCGAKGSKGPTYSQCETYYLNSTTRAAIFENENISLNGTQMWTVPKSGYYTIFARGAAGGNGLYNHPGANGALVRAVFFLQEGDTIFVSIGQSGSNACSSITKDIEQCKPLSKSSILNSSPNSKSRIEIGGGGGGATYVFKFKPHLNEKWKPLLIAGGGGGGSGKIDSDFKHSINQLGQGFDLYNLGTPGNGDGSGGGWNNSKFSHTQQSNQTGKPLLFGAEGGSTCKQYSRWETNGGFGGGGGGCTMGGGGGGYHGGNSNKPSEAGSGGTSYVDFGQSFLQLYSDTSANGSQVTFPSKYSINSSQNHYEDRQDGLVVIIPQIDDCCNDGKYSCLITDEFPNGTGIKHCICEGHLFMLNACVYERHLYLTILWIVLCILVLIFIIIFFVSSVIQKRNAKHKQLLHRNESNDMHLLSNSSTDVQLSRLRNHNAITEYNPNYEFGGSTCTLQDLKEIPREKLNLVKALGQGAFGEVYQGYLQNMPGEITDELPVAVKTLPEYSANKQAEMDFLMEALIMSKFKHKNVVRFIGICFEKMPRFIILELLPGGDLKTFLRENRGTIDVPSPLLMGDLLVMSLDVACGCQYLEDNHFIHRDIAARNCLLTSKVKMPSSINSTIASQLTSGTFDIANYKSGFNNSGIVVKIADFGMARDIYRADYYRKGGKAMLPVKWMPPEAFLDGVFTSKTDIWSFGVLLWEVMSMGYMPYPGRGNQEVMQLVTAGGRLEPPNSATPSQIYAIMAQCWNATPEFRPNFATIIERISYCLQDPDVLSVSLPIFHRAASVEKDMTLMRPPPDATDYLIPNNPGSQTNSNYSMTTEKTELLSPDTCSSFSCINDEKLLEIDDQIQNDSEDHNAIQLWNDSLFSNQPALPFNLNADFANNSIAKPSYSGIVLNPNNLTNLNFQQPCIRYVNVNVNNEIYNSNANAPTQSNSNLDSAGKNVVAPTNLSTCNTGVNC